MPEAVPQLGVGPRRNGNRSLSGHPSGVSGSLRSSAFRFCGRFGACRAKIALRRGHLVS